MELKKCIMTENDCYKKGKKITPKGIVVHSSGANNPKLSRYVQPDDGILGKNKYGNHWNRRGVQKCVHAIIGKDKDGKVRVYQTLPFTMRCWGCGSGKKGSYNDDYIQFEILEDGLTDETYFKEAFNLAIEFCKERCKEFNIPVNNIVSHKEAYTKGYASNHGDCDHWLKKFNKDMNWFRNEVGKKTVSIPAPAPASTPSVKYFPKYTGTSSSIVDALKAVGASSSYSYRKTIAKANGIKLYTGLGSQNKNMVLLLKKGKLIKP